MMADRATEASVPLRRRLGLPLLVLYGTGITVGAGIYALIGAIAGHAGIYAPWSFVLAAVGMGLTVVARARQLPAVPLAEGTSLATLVVFALINLSLLRLRYRGVQSKTPHVTIPVLVPAAGFATCIAMMAFAFLK